MSEPQRNPGLQRNPDPQHTPGPQECADYLEQIVYFLDNELDDDDCAALRAHLEACEPCLEKYDLQRMVKYVVARSCAEQAPSGLRERVRFSLQQVSIEIREY